MTASPPHLQRFAVYNTGEALAELDKLRAGRVGVLRNVVSVLVFQGQRRSGG